MRTYYNPNNGNTAILNESTAKVIFHNSGKNAAFTNKYKAADFLRKHGYILICIK